MWKEEASWPLKVYSSESPSSSVAATGSPMYNPIPLFSGKLRIPVSVDGNDGCLLPTAT